MIPVPAEAGKSSRNVTEPKGLQNALDLIRSVRLLGLAILLSAVSAFGAAASLLPDRIGSFQKIGGGAATLSNTALFQELGVLTAESGDYKGPGGRQTVTAYQMKDTTGALATWEWMRTQDDHACDLAPYCAQNKDRVLLLDANYVIELRGTKATKAELATLTGSLPDRRESSLPPVITFVPRKDLVANSARYILGPVSLSQVTPELAKTRPGFDSGAEAHYTAYNTGAGSLVRLALFYYPTPEMARVHTVDFKLVPGASVKRSGVLVAVVLPGATQQQSDALLGQIEYEAKITWNEAQQGNPVPTLYRLLMNIIIVSLILVGLCLTAGIMYAMMRLYRRRFGKLEEDEAMTTLHLHG
jgi:hypothetical protein